MAETIKFFQLSLFGFCRVFCRMSSEIFRINKNLCHFSPNGGFIATAFQTNLIIKYTQNCETIHSFIFSDVIEGIEWAPDSKYILCFNLKRAIIQVFSLSYPDWKCKITEGSAGLENVTWAPDSKSIITFADFNIQLSVWSLKNRSVVHIQHLKSSANKNLEFSPDGKSLAVIVTDENKDYVEIYKIQDWKLSRKLICEPLSSINGLSWSPNNENLCIWCSNSDDSKLIVYCTTSESQIGVFCPKYSLQPERENVFYRELRGIEIVKWMPSSQLIAIAGHNEMVALVNNVTWKPLIQLHCNPVITDTHYHNRVFKETIIINKDPNVTSSVKHKHVLEEVSIRPIYIPIAKRDKISESQIACLDILEFSSCGRFLAIRHQIYPSTLWILEVTTGDIDFLLLQNDISGVKWSSVSPCLMVFTESTYIFKWHQNEVTCTPTPKDITILDAQWNRSGKSIILYGYNKACLLNLDDS